MSVFGKKKAKGVPAVSTASLPDIIFILLFFFMVVTVIKESELMVKQILPKATQLTKLEKKNLVSYINIGSPIGKYKELLGTAPQIQLNDAFAKPSDIIGFVDSERTKVDENLKDYMTWSLKVDVEVTMGIVSDVKQELRKAEALKLNYAAESPGLK